MSTSNNNTEDLRLVSKIKRSNCNESFKTLSSRYDNFYFSVVRKYQPILSQMGLSQDEIKYEKEFILNKAIISFKRKYKVKFSSWFCNCVKYHFLNYINSGKKYINMEDKSVEYFNVKEAVHELNTQNSETFEYVSSLLSSFRDKRVKDIFQMRYFSGEPDLMTWSRIGRKLKISTQTAINLHERARVFLKNKMESKHLCDLI